MIHLFFLLDGDSFSLFSTRDCKRQPTPSGWAHRAYLRYLTQWGSRALGRRRRGGDGQGGGILAFAPTKESSSPTNTTTSFATTTTSSLLFLEQMRRRFYLFRHQDHDFSFLLCRICLVSRVTISYINLLLMLAQQQRCANEKVVSCNQSRSQSYINNKITSRWPNFLTLKLLSVKISMSS